MKTTFLQRLQTEKDELVDRLSKLLIFIDSNNFSSLSDANQVLLKMQAEHMNNYLNILIIRVELLEEK
jgi:hypothetical protein